MAELDLRALVRDAVERHLGRQDPGANRLQAPLPAPSPLLAHGLYVTLVNTADECVIEPSVRCDRCGYCKSHGY